MKYFSVCSYLLAFFFFFFVFWEYVGGVFFFVFAFYHLLLGICIDGGDTGFLSIMLMSASRSCYPFSRFIRACSPEQGRWIWNGGVRVSPNILSNVGWDKSCKWLSCLWWIAEEAKKSSVALKVREVDSKQSCLSCV